MSNSISEALISYPSPGNLVKVESLGRGLVFFDASFSIMESSGVTEGGPPEDAASETGRVTGDVSGEVFEGTFTKVFIWDISEEVLSGTNDLLGLSVLFGFGGSNDILNPAPEGAVEVLGIAPVDAEVTTKDADVDAGSAEVLGSSLDVTTS